LLHKIMGLREAVVAAVLGLLLMVSSYLLSSYLPEANLSNFSSLPGFFFGLGLFLVMLGLIGSFLIQTDQRRRIQYERRRAYERAQVEPLVVEAHRWLGEIKFQQSFSSGWGGSFKGTIAPIAVEAKAEAAMSLAQNQMSLPEIMDGYREFLELASEEYEVIIGIDELDKIGSDEQAHRFLNEIKALFGIERCFYLLSVSENALSSFERRGLPVRDVFDSSFDAIINVNYLNLDRARLLLRRRAIGVPVPFLDFCHCMAGGLPRDLIRVFRALFEARDQENGGENDLSTLSCSLIRSDLESKLRAASIEAKDIRLEPEVEHFIERIDEVESLLKSADWYSGSCPALLENYQDLMNGGNQRSARQEESAKVASKREKLTSLNTELGVYVFYCVTLLEFFGQENLDKEALKAAKNSGALDQLARARQIFAISPGRARSVIADFRKQYGMAVPQMISTNPDTHEDRSSFDRIGATS